MQQNDSDAAHGCLHPPHRVASGLTALTAAAGHRRQPAPPAPASLVVRSGAGLGKTQQSSAPGTLSHRRIAWQPSSHLQTGTNHRGGPADGPAPPGVVGCIDVGQRLCARAPFDSRQALLKAADVQRPQHSVEHLVGWGQGSSLLARPYWQCWHPCRWRTCASSTAAALTPNTPRDEVAYALCSRPIHAASAACHSRQRAPVRLDWLQLCENNTPYERIGAVSAVMQCRQ